MVSNSALAALTARSLRRLALASILCLVGVPLVSAQTGPVASPPGGATTTDSDSGNGQSWGRAGGRTLTYAIANPSQYSLLQWGVTNATAPSLAFDGTTSPNTAEVMTFDTNSALAQGKAVWTGAAQLTANAQNYQIPTRFTLTVTSNGQPVPLTAANGSLTPAVGVNALSSTSFSVNMLFEADNSPMVGGAANYKPALDFYDAAVGKPLGPLPGSTGPAISELSVAFYYSTTVVTTNDPDAAQTTQIATDVTALTTNVATLQTGVTGLQTGLTGLSTTLGAGLTQLQATLLGLSAQLGTIAGTDFTALQSSVNSAVQQITQTNTNLTSLQSAIQGSLSVLQVTASQVAAPEEARRPRSAWLLQTTYGGQLVNASLSSLIAVVTTRNGTVTQDVSAQATVLPIAPGILEVTLSRLPAGAQLLQFTAQYQVNTNTLATGSVMTPYVRAEGDR